MLRPAELTAYTQPLDRAYVRAFKTWIRSDVAKHFAEFFLEAESNFERANLDSSTSVLRQLLLSFVHTAAQNADSPQHRAAGWRFIDWNEVEQRELLAEAKRLLGGTAAEPHALDAEAEATDSESEAHVLEPLADDHSSDGEDAPTGVEESAAPAVAAAPEQQTAFMTALCHCVARKMSSASPARACMSASIASLSFVAASLPIHSICVIVVSILHVFRQFHRLHLERGQITNATAINAVPVLEDVHAGTTQEWSLQLNVPQHEKTHQFLTCSKN